MLPADSILLKPTGMVCMRCIVLETGKLIFEDCHAAAAVWTFGNSSHAQQHCYLGRCKYVRLSKYSYTSFDSRRGEEIREQIPLDDTERAGGSDRLDQVL